MAVCGVGLEAQQHQRLAGVPLGDLLERLPHPRHRRAVQVVTVLAPELVPIVQAEHAGRRGEQPDLLVRMAEVARRSAEGDPDRNALLGAEGSPGAGC